MELPKEVMSKAQKKYKEVEEATTRLLNLPDVTAEV